MELKQAREAFESFKESKAGRIAKRGKDFVWKFTPWGRYDEYMEKFRDTLTHPVRGRERYDLRLQLEKDARRYARNKVVRDLAIATATVGGTILLKRELNPANRASDLAKLQQLGDRAIRFGRGVAEAPARATQAIKDAPLHVAATAQVTAETVGKAMAQGVQEKASSTLHSIAAAAPVVKEQAKARGWEIFARILGSKKPRG